MDGTSFSRNALPITLLSIAAFTVAGLVVGYTGEPMVDASMGWMLFGVMMIVALADLFVLRLVLESLFASAPDRISSGEATVPRIVDSACILVVTFSTAGAVYGLIVAIMTGNGWLALPLGAISVITCAVTMSRVRTATDRLRNEAAAVYAAA